MAGNDHGEPGLPRRRRAAWRANWAELLLESQLRQMVAEEFGGESALPDKLYPQDSR
jgi:hypothetical protein